MQFQVDRCFAHCTDFTFIHAAYTAHSAADKFEHVQLVYGRSMWHLCANQQF